MGTLCRAVWICALLSSLLCVQASPQLKDAVATARSRRYLAEEEMDGTAGPVYDKPLPGSEGQAGRYHTTSLLPGPTPTANSSAVLAAAANASNAVGNATSGTGAAPPAQPTAPTAVMPPTTANATSPTGPAPSAVPTVPEEQPEILPEIFTNQTLNQHNITTTDEDHHLYYYNSSVVTDEALARSLWVDTEGHPGAYVNQMLSGSHRRAVTIQMSFDFPFYGHPVRNVTVATGGFLYTGDYIHSWLAATQYVAPLMANFDTSMSQDSVVKHIDNGTAFTVQWQDVRLQDQPDAGPFSFQATLHRSGDMVFVYREVPLPIQDIVDDKHPVKVGISDAYIIDRTIFFVRRKTIYEYHRVHLTQQAIRNWTVVTLTALPTCTTLTTCDTCLTGLPTFQCQWCKGRCSDGVDRRRQEWLQLQCDRQAVTDEARCPPTATSADVLRPVTAAPARHASASASRLDGGPPADAASGGSRGASLGVSGAVAVLCAVVLVAVVAVWVLYAYRNPHTASGQFLIRYRPSQWSWRRGEARYTAATIHM